MREEVAQVLERKLLLTSAGVHGMSRGPLLELLLPLKSSADVVLFSAGHQFDLKFLEHRALILHAARTGTDKDPRICLTVVPLSFENYLDSEGNTLPLSAPDPLRVAATFPVMKENRKE